MKTQVLYAEYLPEIPSEYLELYLQRFLMSRLESLAMGFKTAAEVKNDISVIDEFVSMFGGIHAQCAQSNETNRIQRATDEQLTEIAKKIFN